MRESKLGFYREERRGTERLCFYIYIYFFIYKWGRGEIMICMKMLDMCADKLVNFGMLISSIYQEFSIHYQNLLEYVLFLSKIKII